MKAKHTDGNVIQLKGMAKLLKGILLVGFAAALLPGIARAQTLYSTNFDGMTVGASVVGQGGWSLFSGDASYATIQSASGNNYLQFVGVTGVGDVRVIREMPANTLSASESISLSLAFRTSTLSGVPFIVNMLGNGGAGYITQMYVDASGSGIHVTADAGNFAFNESASFSSLLSTDTWYIAEAAIQPTLGTVNYSFYETVGGDSSQRGAKILDASFALANTSLAFTSVYSIDFTHDALSTPVWDMDYVQVATVPEPSVLGLLGLGVVAVGVRAWRKRSRLGKNS